MGQILQLDGIFKSWFWDIFVFMRLPKNQPYINLFRRDIWYWWIFDNDGPKRPFIRFHIYSWSAFLPFVRHLHHWQERKLQERDAKAQITQISWVRLSGKEKRTTAISCVRKGWLIQGKEGLLKVWRHDGRTSGRELSRTVKNMQSLDPCNCKLHQTSE